VSVYEEKYQVHHDKFYSYYTSDPAKALSLFNRDPKNNWVAEGYPVYRDMNDGRTMVTRETVGKVLPSTLEFRVQRAAVQKMLEKL
jgi:hypothetical protein